MAPKLSAYVVYLFFLTWSIAQTFSNYSKRSNLYPACCAVYQFNFTSFGSRRGETSAQMGYLAITPSLMRYLRCRRSTTDSFNANESAKHASFIQYVLCHISRLGRYGPCDGCKQHRLFTMIRRVPWHASSDDRSRTYYSVEHCPPASA